MAKHQMVNDEEKQTSGYFGVSHNRNRLAYSRALLREFEARFKHALLFNNRLLLCDHMVVNSPNFRYLYRTDSSFRDLISDEFIDIARVEVYQHDKSKVMDLVDLRDFYNRLNLIHKEMPLIFSGQENDAELVDIQQSVKNIIPAKPLERDRSFTAYAEDEIKKGTLQLEFGDIYGAYKQAFRDILRDNSTLGIIHFDREHREAGGKDIFDYMAALDSISSSSNSLRRKFGRNVAQLHRTLLIKSELSILPKLYPIIPTDLSSHIDLLWSDKQSKFIIEDNEKEKEGILIDLSALSVETLASLNASEIRSLRKSDEGQKFLSVIGRAKASDLDIKELMDIIENYTDLISKSLRNKTVRSRKKVNRGRNIIRAIRGNVKSEDGLSMGKALILDTLGLVGSASSLFVPINSIKSFITSVNSGMFDREKMTNISVHDIKAAVVPVQDEFIIRYK